MEDTSRRKCQIIHCHMQNRNGIFKSDVEDRCAGGVVVEGEGVIIVIWSSGSELQYLEPPTNTANSHQPIGGT